VAVFTIIHNNFAGFLGGVPAWTAAALGYDNIVIQTVRPYLADADRVAA
jgi:hypothetical protein